MFPHLKNRMGMMLVWLAVVPVPVLLLGHQISTREQGNSLDVPSEEKQTVSTVDAQTSERVNALARFHFGRFELERRKLLSGIVHGMGRRTYRYPDGEVIRRDNEKLDIAFDHAKGLMRVDRTYQFPSQRGGGAENRILEDVFESHFIRTPPYDVCEAHKKSDRGRVVWITKPEWPVSQNAPAYPFDIRTISFATEIFDWLRPTPLDQYRKELPPEFNEYTDEGDGVHRFSYIHVAPPAGQKLTVRYSNWLHEERGCSVFKTLHEFIIPETPDAKWRVMTESETAWDEVGGAWVPMYHALSQKVNVNPGRPCVSVQMRFNWVSVNKRVPERYFSISDFGLPPGAPVKDARNTKGRIADAVLLGHVRDFHGGLKSLPAKDRQR